MYYYKTYKNQTVKKLDLLEILKASKGKVLTIESETENNYETVTID